MQELLMPRFADYELIDTGDFEKLERFGAYVTRRPEPQAVWRRSLPEEEWRRLADASFLRDGRSEERGEWHLRRGVADRWTIDYAYGGMSLRMRLGFTSFKHVGIFPEQAANWEFIYDRCAALAAKGGARSGDAERGGAAGEAPRVLNLFAYTGGATLAARAAGADVTHVDSVKPVVSWAGENMTLSGLSGVRWIVEDALRFVRREVRRGRRYRGIMLDPPAYGRGANGEKWVLEDNLCEMLECCAQLLEPEDSFLVLNLYSMGLSSTLARTAVHQAFGAPAGEQWGELCFEDRAGKQLPLGTYYRMMR
ncbi:class I SAM-dependent methyltransferase [uncultured Alistipes sp.]|uniref:class I SAM-dependent methyltransferase n=1 Tax=uncultured Alistipes sp. TaxID=538949 RepID=UPI0025FE4DB1|nr:class I SAM-dependent methyltransferase [uncultured Alistipes sp.]